MQLLHFTEVNGVQWGTRSNETQRETMGGNGGQGPMGYNGDGVYYIKFIRIITASEGKRGDNGGQRRTTKTGDAMQATDSDLGRAHSLEKETLRQAV